VGLRADQARVAAVVDTRVKGAYFPRRLRQARRLRAFAPSPPGQFGAGVLCSRSMEPERKSVGRLPPAAWIALGRGRWVLSRPWWGRARARLCGVGGLVIRSG
jgi:hypothetical protein